jgi:hypothetical protein
MGKAFEDSVLGLLEKLGARNSVRILHMGSGNSDVPEHLWRLGFGYQVAVDISQICTGAMAARQKVLEAESSIGVNEDTPILHYLCRDVCDLSVDLLEASPSGAVVDLSQAYGSFDFVFDKSTTDALMCVETGHALTILTYFREVWKSLRKCTAAEPDPVFCLVSLHPPEEIDSFLRLPCFGWEIEVVLISADVHPNCRPAKRQIQPNFVYVCTKTDDTGEEELEAEWTSVFAAAFMRPDDDPLS